MPDDSAKNQSNLEFQCPKCGKRLKAGAAFAGRRVKCPSCQQAVTVPGIPSDRQSPPARAASGMPGTAPAPRSPVAAGPTASPIQDDDWLNLGTPAIADAAARQEVFEERKKEKERERIAKQVKQRNRDASMPAAQVRARPTQRPTAPADPRVMNEAVRDSAVPEDDFALAPLTSTSRSKATNPGPATGKPTPPEPKRSVFDEDLPELSELQWSTAKPNSAADKLLARHAGVDLTELDQLVPAAGVAPSAGVVPPTKATKSPRATQPPEDTDPEYRVSCTACGTAQYVRLSNQGVKIKCPDCFLVFKVPPPPPNWSPKKQPKLELTHEDMPLAAGEELQQLQIAESQRSRASQIMEKAQLQVTDEDIDNLYSGDFDTAGFLQRTFGFLKDPVAIAHIFGYAIIFGGIFAAGQFAANMRDTQYGPGLILLIAISTPAIGLVFAMPLLSSGIALLESVANRQSRVSEWPGFNIFENAGDVAAVTIALLAAMTPGFVLGLWLGGEAEGAGRMQIAGMMLTSFVLFPVFMLSMLDTGSVFAPLSSAVFRSFAEAAESWAGYYLKTFFAFSTTMLLWFLLLGKNEILAGLAGSLFPVLVFFTCQQMGALADGISEHLSIEFVPPVKDESGEAEGDSRAANGKK